MFRLFLSTAASILAAGVAHGASVDVVEYPDGYFAPDTDSTLDSPYYRSADQDWGWTHGAISPGFLEANLQISAYDVDRSSGELDEIFALDGANWISLGYLEGSNNEYSYTEFSLDSSLFDDIENGLELRIDIDTADAGWIVTLAKSVITTDGAVAPPPTPGASAVPLPAGLPLMAAAFGMLALLHRRRS